MTALTGLLKAVKEMMSGIQFGVEILEALLILALFCLLIAAFRHLVRKTFNSWW